PPSRAVAASVAPARAAARWRAGAMVFTANWGSARNPTSRSPAPSSISPTPPPSQRVRATPVRCAAAAASRAGATTATASSATAADAEVAERAFAAARRAAGVSCSTWWSRAGSAVKRSLVLDDLVYSIADDRVKVQRLGQFGVDVADIPL